MIKERALSIASLFVLLVSTTACPFGTFDCTNCNAFTGIAAGVAGLDCPTNPSGTGAEPSGCVQWFPGFGNECVDFFGSCTTYSCCPDGTTFYTGCFALPGHDCRYVFACAPICCPGPAAYEYIAFDCNNDGFIDLVLRLVFCVPGIPV